jgi:perosamine synthetase
MRDPISVSSPLLVGRERENVLECLNKQELSWNGPFVKRFETEFAQFCGTKYAVSCCNGTAALHLSLLALGVTPGDCVILPSLTYIATANVVRYCGATPIFCDVDPRTWCLDPNRVASALHHLQTKRVIILPVHLYGVMADMTSFNRLAEEFGFHVVEDAAEAHGAIQNSRRSGSFGDMGVFSFYGNKILTCGEGGMITTDDPYLNEKLRLYRGQGQSKDRRYWHEVIGYNYRLTNLQAAVGVAQLETYPVQQSLRSQVFKWYLQTELSTLERQERPCGSANWMFSVLLPKEIDRDRVIANLQVDGIETRPVFPLVTDMPMYQGPYAEVASDISARGINLPTHPSLQKDEIYYISDKVFEEIQSCGYH